MDKEQYLRAHKEKKEFASEGYSNQWVHVTVHFNPTTKTLHCDGKELSIGLLSNHIEGLIKRAEKAEAEVAKLREEAIETGKLLRDERDYHEYYADMVIELTAEVAKLRKALFCEECKGVGVRFKTGWGGTVIGTEPCPTCGPLRKELRSAPNG